MVHVKHLDLRLTADPARVVIRPFHIAPEPRDKNKPESGRIARIVNSVLKLSPAECVAELALVNHDFEQRHWQTRLVYFERFAHVAAELELNAADLSEAQRELIGACFCHEYSYAAAAIMNPSIVPHPDQSGLFADDVRFVMSLRTVGEGHISSIAFREGIFHGDGAVSLMHQPPFAVAVSEAADCAFDAKNVTCVRNENVSLSGTVIFPFTPQQRNGLEDLRLLKFKEDDGSHTYMGAYTAYSGSAIASELLTTKDFRRFQLKSLSGGASRGKGMAFFPRKLDGAYACIGRQDHENLYYMRSDDLLAWDGGERIMEPRFGWERIQIGNCGAPIELEEGWLLLTHGVGAMRQYSMGAVLLDKKDPRKILGRLPTPLLRPSDEMREGYVPNVVYTCGALVHKGVMLLPYGVADSSVAFGLVEVKDLLKELV